MEETPPKMEFCSSLTGAIDIGRLLDGRLELVEMHAPIACGWYGDRKDNLKYGLWQHLSYIEDIQGR